MRIVRKLTALLLSLVMIASMGAAMAFAEDEGTSMALGRSSRQPERGYVFGEFVRGEDTPVGISSIEFDGGNGSKSNGLAIYKTEDGVIRNRKPIDLDMSGFIYEADKFELEKSNIAPEGSPNAGTFNAVMLKLKRSGATKVSYKINDSTIISIMVTIKNFGPAIGYAAMFGPKEQDEHSAPMSGFTETREQSNDVWNAPSEYHFANTKADGSKELFTSWELAPNSFRLSQAAENNPQVSDAQLAEIFVSGTNQQGEKTIELIPKYRGTFYMTPVITVNAVEMELKPYTLVVTERKGEIVTSVREGESINEALAKLPKFENTPNNEYKSNKYILHLRAAQGTDPDTVTFDNEKDEIIVLDKPVIINGDGRQKTILKSQIVVDMPEVSDNNGNLLRAELSGLTQVSREHRKGTAVKIAQGANHSGAPRFVGKMDVRGFDIGYHMTSGYIRSGMLVEDCNIGMIVVTHAYGTSLSYDRTFKNNSTAIQIAKENTNTNPFALGFAYCNFIGNSVNIDNLTQAPYNFSFNYYDNGDTASAFNNVRHSPYYKDPVDNQDNPPKDTYISPDEMKGRIDVSKTLLKADTVIQTGNVGSQPLTLDLVTPSNDGVVKNAGWAFGGMKENGVTSFNPAIATELKDSSDTAVSTLPAGAKYQPVSFAHSGTLPGTATVSVVKDTEAPVNNLKLYKVVNGKLVKQPEPVSFVNGEYVFNRDGASDYIITDTDLGGGTNSGGSDGSGSSGASGGGYTDSGEVGSKLDSTPAGGTASIDVSAKPNVGATAFDLLKKDPGKTLVLKGDGYSWSFKGSDLIQNIPGLISVNTAISKTSPNAEAIKKLTGDAPIMNVYFSYHGMLPGKATIELEADKSLGNKPLNLYYYNSVTGRLSMVHSGLAVKNGKVSFDITHCSDYLLTPNVIPGAGRLAVANMPNPDTGARDVVSVAMSIALVCGLGALALLRKRK